mmetsp:Transcript_94089/g.181497  ORF Transcript_94089/g.181497 Transcript_94089/m.181497 type:complete len:98 (-) Transcript_94089:660-953(-)
MTMPHIIIAASGALLRMTKAVTAQKRQTACAVIQKVYCMRTVFHAYTYAAIAPTTLGHLRQALYVLNKLYAHDASHSQRNILPTSRMPPMIVDVSLA